MHETQAKNHEPGTAGGRSVIIFDDSLALLGLGDRPVFKTL
jgi:hypothetical protein